MMLTLRHILRSLSRAPGFTIAVVLTLGLGIGANTAIFSVVRGVLLKPLPHRDGDRLMYLRQSTDAVDNVAFSVPEINDFREQSKALAQVAEYSPLTLNLVEDQDATQIDVGLVTGNYLSVMGLRPVLGRPFNDADDGAGAAPVIMLADGYWRTHFGADPGIVGKSLRIGGRPVEVIGVLQPAPFFPGRIDGLMNMSISEHHVSAMMVQGRSHRMTEMIARVAPDVSLEQAQADVAAVTQRMYAANPEAYQPTAGYKITMTPLHEVLGQDARLTLFLLMGAAAFVLVIACANVANLTLMRGVRREHEMTVRAALGAGTLRLRRLLLAENAVLALAGAALGLVVAYGGVGMLARFAARFSVRSDEIAVDGMVLAFTFVLALVVALVLAFAPSIGDEGSLGVGLRAGGTKSSGGMRRKRLQQGLVVTQVAVSLVLLTGAGLLTRSMMRLAAVDSGLEPGNVLTMEVPIDFTQAASLAGAVGMYERMQQELSTLPGVEVVGVGSTMPLRSAQFQLEIKAEGRPVAPGEPVLQSEYRTADPGYFRASGINIVKGRDFTANDRAGGYPVAIINETLANILFPGIDPVGRRIAWSGDVLQFIGIPQDQWREVVGVVADTKDGGLDSEPLPVTFLPFAQGFFPSGGLVMRSQVDAAGLAPAARAIVRSVAPTQPVENILTVDDIRDESVGPRRLNAMLVGSFGLLALVIAAIGIAAVLAFSVSARTNEIGIRMSLGAAPGRVQRMVIREGGVLVVIGLVLGVVGSLALARLMQGLLFGVEPHDPATLLAVAVTMAAIGVGACWLPAARASRIDPSEALRAQ
ncbi:MAG TPA: ABC transporter permease [Gemmatimonadaceae bacterium]|nr:ABC transporter permease [Gemmatimonadaceae bacterium]